MFFGKLLAVAAGAASLVASTSARPAFEADDVSFANSTLQARTVPLGWTTERCKTISGTFGIGCFQYKYNFGCICYDDVDTYCGKMNYGSNIANYMKGLFTASDEYNYPGGSQPTCNSGGWTCPTGTSYNSKTGTCTKSGTTTIACGTGYCAQSDGTCCPRGMKSFNGQCCNVNCQGVSNGQCIGERTCASGQTLSNGLCCASGWTGYTKTCCPSGQKEDPSNPGQCICTDASLKPSSDGKTCVSRCTTTNTKWCTSQCCRSDMNEVGGKCQCPDGYKDNGSKCVLQCPTSGTRWCTSTCCRNDMNEVNGKCQCPDGYKDNGSACVAKCPTTGTRWCQSTCCRNDMNEVNGKCACADGYKDNGKACVPQCDDQHTWDSSRQQCLPKCDTSSGYTWGFFEGSTTNGKCCPTGQSCKKTKCCPTDSTEYSNGLCCASGQVPNSAGNACAYPTGKPKPRRRALTGQVSLAEQQQLNLDIKLCPSGLSACPIKGATAGQYECIDSQNDIQSCGGCSSLDKGVDCTAIPGVRFVGCSVGQCEVFSCLKGYRMEKTFTGDNKCVKI